MATDKIIIPLDKLLQGIKPTPLIYQKDPEVGTVLDVRVSVVFEKLNYTTDDADVVTDPVNSKLAVLGNQLVLIDQSLGVVIYD